MVATTGRRVPRCLDPTWTRSGTDRVGWSDCSLHIEPFLRSRLINGCKLNARYYGQWEPVPLIWRVFCVTVQIVLSSVQTRLQKRANTGSRPTATFQTSGPGWVWIQNFDRLPSLLCRTGLGSVLVIIVIEIRYCPESVGVGKFCRLRLRLRLRAKQPTPTDSDSDSAALLLT